jgi:hypothetical protein
MESRTHSDKNGRVSEVELAGLRGGLAHEVMTLGLFIPTLCYQVQLQEIYVQRLVRHYKTIANNGIRELLIQLEA